ncbi:hypothetical protein SNEBB_007201 [Seison nebaliae]|nr:hypothetical protein SNEBB_007201 [Seison nebaliae]
MKKESMNKEKDAFQWHFIKERDDRVRNIENEAGEVETMFHQINTHVHSQQDNVDNIESNVSTSLLDNGSAVRHIQDVHFRRERRRRRICMMIGASTLFIIMISLIIWAKRSSK